MLRHRKQALEEDTTEGISAPDGKDVFKVPLVKL